jgi:hypothetical protein
VTPEIIHMKNFTSIPLMAVGFLRENMLRKIPRRIFRIAVAKKRLKYLLSLVST